MCGQVAVSAAGLLLIVLPLGGCQLQRFDLDAETLNAYRTRVARMPPSVPPPGRTTPARAASTQPASTQPETAGLEALDSRRSSRVVRLGLLDALHRGLANSLDIKVEGFSPGISAADLVAAEAAFDAVFFTDFTFSKLDQPTNSTTIGGGQSEDRRLSSGLRKRLATGGEVSARYAIDRAWSNQAFQRYNTHYRNDLTLELRQPLLQDFGIDVNRAQICVARNRRDISLFVFRRQVIDTLARIEQAYWDLFFTRQSLAIQRELLAQTEETQDRITERLKFDATLLQQKQATLAVASRRATIVRIASEVKDAEDQLKNLLNDPNLPLDEDIAIIPTDDPMTERLALDEQQELWTGLENRGELQEARLNVANASIARGVARNQLLPKLDLLLQWNVSGLRDNFPHANEQLFGGDYQDYVVGLTFEWPIGNRAGQAQVRKSQLQLEQAVAAYHNIAADVMTQVQVALRDVRTSYDEILASREAAAKAEETLQHMKIVYLDVATGLRLSAENLDLYLRTQEALASARRTLHLATSNYNKAVVRLEQAKGTLLRYDRVELAPDRQ